jgi:hypothetical protein
MAEQASGVSGKLAGWLKGLITSVVGLCSGAVLMYASPLIDRVVKPAKPVANFAAEPLGLQVTFQNRSTGGTEGWWDFGDGSALVPYVANQGSVSHTYGKAGIYTAKLSLKNLLGEDNERAVNVNLDNSAPAAPAIDTFTVVPISPNNYAPATFRVVSKIKNADLCVWALGEDRPLEVSTDIAGCQDRLVTFKRPGPHAVRLAVVSGKQVVEKNEVVRVAAPPAGSATAVLKVTREAAQVVATEKQRVVPVSFPAHSKDTTMPLDKTIAAADLGFQVKSVQVVNAVNATGVKAEITPDGRQIRLTGQLVRPTGILKIPLQAPPQAVVVLKVNEEKVLPASTHTPDMVAGTMTVPGAALLSMPKLATGWVLQRQSVSVEVHDGDRVVWQSSQVPAAGIVLFQNRQCRVNASLSGDQVRVDLTPVDPRSGLTPVGN